MKRIVLIFLMSLLVTHLSSFADVGCNSIQSVACTWSCPGGGQGYFCVISDGCHMLIKYEGCDGTYADFYYSVYKPSNPNSGNREVNNLFGMVQEDFIRLTNMKNQTNFDIKDFQNSSINKIAKVIVITDEKGAKTNIKGTIKPNFATQKDVIDFNGRFKDEITEKKGLDKKDIKKDDK